jgi:hypothetical protein
VKVRVLKSDGTYVAAERERDAEAFDSQEFFVGRGAASL